MDLPIKQCQHACCCNHGSALSDVCHKKDLFHDPCDVIITLRMAVNESVDKYNNNVLPLAIPLVKYTRLVVVIMMVKLFES